MKRSFSLNPANQPINPVNKIFTIHPDKKSKLETANIEMRVRPPSFALPQKNTKQYLIHNLNQQQELISRKCLGIKNDLPSNEDKRDFQRIQTESYKRNPPQKNKVELQSPVRMVYKRPNTLVTSQFIKPVKISEEKLQQSENKKIQQIQQYQNNKQGSERKQARPARAISQSVILSSSSGSKNNSAFKKQKSGFNIVDQLYHKKNSSGSKIEFFASPTKKKTHRQVVQNSDSYKQKIQTNKSNIVSLANIKKIKSSYVIENNSNSSHSKGDLASPGILRRKEDLSIGQNTQLCQSLVFDSQENFSPVLQTQSMGLIKLEQVASKSLDLSVDDFQIYDKIGKGAFGDVFIAKQKKSGFLCAIKTLSKKKIKQQNIQQQVLRQIKIQSFMNHRHLTSLYGIFDDKQKIYLVMEYMPDGCMPKSLKNISQSEAAYLIKQVCQGLIALHQQKIIHRDIKPQNLLMNQGYVKIGDFGCSVFTNSERNTVVGCFSYISPQQLSNTPYDDKIDVWSVGILAYQLLFGKPPFQQQLMKRIGFQSKRGTGDTQSSLQILQFPPLNFPQNCEISIQAKQFIQNLLSQNSNHRMEIRQALRHKFLQKSQQWQNQLQKRSHLK